MSYLRAFCSLVRSSAQSNISNDELDFTHAGYETCLVVKNESPCPHFGLPLCFGTCYFLFDDVFIT